MSQVNGRGWAMQPEMGVIGLEEHVKLIRQMAAICKHFQEDNVEFRAQISRLQKECDILKMENAALRGDFLKSMDNK